MATEIASLYAKISADTSGLQRGLKTTKSELQGASREMDRLSFGSVGSMVTQIGIATGVITAFGYAAKKAFDIGREGAEIEYAAGKFDRLAASIGTTSDALRADLKSATRGMMTDAEMMASAGDLMALGLAKTHDEAVRLTRVASALGMNMNQLVLTLTNRTTMRFDQLGVSVDDFEAKVKRLEATGLSASEAFKQAFLTQAEEQIERVGDKADSTAGAYQRLTVAVQQQTDTMKQHIADALLPLVERLTELLTVNDQLEAQTRNLDGTYEEYLERIYGVIAANQGLAYSDLQLTAETTAAAMGINVLTQEQWNAVQAGRAVDSTMSGESVRMGQLGQSAITAAGQVGALKSSLMSIPGIYTAIIRVITQNVSAGFLEANPELRTGMTYLYNQNPGTVQAQLGDNWRPDYQLPPVNFSSGGGGGGGAIGGIQMAAKEAWRIAMEAANAMSSLGQLAADSLQKDIIDPMEKRIQAIDALLAPGHADLYAIEHAAELERQRAEAAEAIADANEKILAYQKQQERLQLLQAQVRLLDLIKENNLNAGDILGGLKLGLDTDMGAVLEAVNRAMEALINEAKEKLGIASPSKVFEGIGQNVVAGLAKGMSGTTPVDAAVKNLFAGVNIAPFYAPGGTGGTTVIEKQEFNFPLEQIRDLLDIERLAYRVAQVMRRQML